MKKVVNSLRLVLSNSKIQTIKRCGKKYYYRYELGLRPRVKAVLPRMGTMAHEGLRAYWMGEDWRKAVDEEWKKNISGFPFPEQITEEERERPEVVKEILERFLKRHKYFRHPDEKDFLHPEHKFFMQIPGINKKWTHTYLMGYWDRVIEVPGEGLWLIEHKFTEQSLDSFFNHLDLNEQLDYYLTALDYLYGHEKPVMGAIVNGIKLKLPKRPKVLKSGKRLSKQKIETDYETYLEAIKENGFDPDDEEYAMELERLKSIPDPFMRTEWVDKSRKQTQNILNELSYISAEIRALLRIKGYTRTRSTGRCGWDCDYKDICLAELKGGDVEGIIEEGFTRPEERRKGKPKQYGELPF